MKVRVMNIKGHKLLGPGTFLDPRFKNRPVPDLQKLINKGQIDTYV